MVKIIGNGWNVPSNVDSTQMMADAVYKIFSTYVGNELENDVLINNNLSQGYPLAHYEKNNGNWEITLSCASGLHWSQIAYQLAHELCHLYCNHSLSRGHKHKWFEESLCECASVAVLHKLGTDWDSFEISSVDPSYSNSITEYLSNLMQGVTVEFCGGNDFKYWLSSRLSQLERNSTQRELNKIVAVYLFGSLLNNDPECWLAITSLNLWDCSKDENFDMFIDNWLLASEKNLEEVKTITNLL